MNDGEGAVALDYEKIAQDYDGMWLTRKGEKETEDRLEFYFGGWDCESTHWFRWVFDEVKSTGKIRIRD